MRRVLGVAVVVAAVLAWWLLTPLAATAAPRASCYGPGLYGNHTASGSVLRAGTVGVAHRTLAFGTKLRVSTGTHVTTVTVIDRGPHVKGRVLDLTEAAVRQLGATSCKTWGVRPVRSWRAR